jgi:hypothetical protein
VTDQQGGQASDAFWLRVNAFPTVDAGGDRSVNEGDSVVLGDASASDPDGWIASYFWSDHGNGGSFDDPGTLHPTYTAPMTDNCSGEDITLSLTVTDDWGSQASDALTLHVQNVNALPDVDAGPDQSVHGGDSVMLIGSASDSDGAIVGTLWEQTAGPNASLSGESTDHAILIAPEVSSQTELRFRLTVLDNCGGSASDETSVQLSSGRSSIEVVLGAQDSRGFPISPLDTLSVGETITYVYTITNTGETSLTDLALVDDRLGEIPLSRSTIAPWEHVTGSFSVTITEADLPGPFGNTVVVTAIDPSGKTVADSDTLVLFDLSSDGRLTLLKTSDTTETAVGDTITYTYTIANTGDVPHRRDPAANERSHSRRIAHRDGDLHRHRSRSSRPVDQRGIGHRSRSSGRNDSN